MNQDALTIATSRAELAEGELATVRDELARCSQAVNAFVGEGDGVSDAVRAAVDALGRAKLAVEGLRTTLTAAEENARIANLALAAGLAACESLRLASKIQHVYDHGGCGRHEAREALEKRGGCVGCAIEYVHRTGLAAVMSDAARYPRWAGCVHNPKAAP